MTSQRAAQFFLAIGLAFLTLPSPALAAESKWNRGELEKFFKLGWDLSPEGRIQAEEHYDQLQPFARGDSRLKYSMVIIKIKQLKYQDALKLVTEVVTTDKADLNAWQAKIWLTVLTKNYSQAMVDLEKAALAMPPMDDADDKGAEAKREMATFMGRVFGFLDGPAASHTNEDDRTAQRKKLIAKLSPERKSLFEDGRQAVIDKYLALTDQAIVSKERAKEGADEEREEKLKGLDEEQQQLEKRRAELGSQRERLNAALRAELDDLAKQDGPLLQRFTALDSRAIVVRRELVLLATAVAQQEAQLAQTKDPQIRAAISFEIGRLSRIAAQYNADLAVLGTQASGIAAQRGQLQQRAVAAQNNFGRQLDQTDKEMGDISKKTNKNVSTEKRLRKPTSADTPESRAKAAQAVSLQTYEHFPLEREKQRLLDSFP